MKRGSEMFLGNPAPGFPLTPSAARGWEPAPPCPKGNA
jgi:hypothetical protein